MKVNQKLDKWDTQILLLSKGHFRSELRSVNKNNIDGLKAIWAERCGISTEHVEEGHLFGHIISILESISQLNVSNVVGIIFNSCFNDQLWKMGVKDKETSTIQKLIYSALGKLSIVQVKESCEIDGEIIWEDLITLEEKDNSFMDIIYEDIRKENEKRNRKS